MTAHRRHIAVEPYHTPLLGISSHVVFFGIAFIVSRIAYRRQAITLYTLRTTAVKALGICADDSCQLEKASEGCGMGCFRGPTDNIYVTLTLLFGFRGWRVWRWSWLQTRDFRKKRHLRSSPPRGPKPSPRRRTRYLTMPCDQTLNCFKLVLSLA